MKSQLIICILRFLSLFSLFYNNYLVYAAGAAQALIGLGATCCGMGTKGRAGCLWPHLVQWYRSTKAAWAVTAVYVFFSVDIFQNHYETIDLLPVGEGKQRVKAVFFTFSVTILVVICYCGFSTHKEVPNDAVLARTLFADDREQNSSAPEEGDIQRPAKVIKKGIFVHGIQIV